MVYHIVTFRIGNKNKCNKTMDTHHFANIMPTQHNLIISVILAITWPQYPTAVVSRTTILVFHNTLHRADTALVANLIITLIARDSFPLFAHSITSSATRLARLAALSSMVSNAVSSPFGATP